MALRLGHWFGTGPEIWLNPRRIYAPCCCRLMLYQRPELLTYRQMPPVMSAKAGIHVFTQTGARTTWIPAFAGMTRSARLLSQLFGPLVLLSQYAIRFYYDIIIFCTYPTKDLFELNLCMGTGGVLLTSLRSTAHAFLGEGRVEF